jgi:hypothetical protein
VCKRSTRIVRVGTLVKLAATDRATSPLTSLSAADATAVAERLSTRRLSRSGISFCGGPAAVTTLSTERMTSSYLGRNSSMIATASCASMTCGHDRE